MRPSQSLLFSLLASALLASGSAAFAQAAPPVVTDCVPKDQLEQFLRKERVPDSVVLAFDHIQRTWSGYKWAGNQLNPLQDEVDLKLPFTNKPRVFLTKEQLGTFEVFVVNTNPLLFGTQDGDNSVANIESLEDLQKLTGLLGNFLASTVAGLSPDFEPAPDEASSPAGLATTIQSSNFELETMSESMPLQDPLKGLAEAADIISSHARNSAGNLLTAMGSTNMPRLRLEQSLRALNETVTEIKSYVQVVERFPAPGSPDRIDPLPRFAYDSKGNPKLRTDFTYEISDAVKALTDAREGLNTFEPLCPEALTLLRDAIRLYRSPLPTSASERKLATDRYQGLLEELQTYEELKRLREMEARGTLTKQEDKDRLKELSKLNPCRADDLTNSIAVLRSHLASNQLSATGPTDREDQILRLLVQSLDGYLTLLDRRTNSLETVAKLFETSSNAAKVGEAVNDFLRRRDTHLIANDNCSLRAGVLRVDRVSSLNKTLKWFQFGSDSVKIVADSPFKGDLFLRHPEVTANYELQRAWQWDFDVDVATYYTELEDPEFHAVDTDMVEATKPIVTQTDADSRAGELAMFLGLQWRPRKTRTMFSIGPQLGVGLSTDKPAIFAGIGIGIGRYVKLGYGRTWQEVKELENQTEGVTPVADDAAIRTRDAYDNKPYIMLSITLDELPFFKAP